MDNSLKHNNKINNIMRMTKTIQQATRINKDSLENIIMISNTQKITLTNKIQPNRARKKNNFKNRDISNNINKLKKKILEEEKKIKTLKHIKSLFKKLIKP